MLLLKLLYLEELIPIIFVSQYSFQDMKKGLEEFDIYKTMKVSVQTGKASNLKKLVQIYGRTNLR